MDRNKLDPCNAVDVKGPKYQVCGFGTCRIFNPLKACASAAMLRDGRKHRFVHSSPEVLWQMRSRQLELSKCDIVLVEISSRSYFTTLDHKLIGRDEIREQFGDLLSKPLLRSQCRLSPEYPSTLPAVPLLEIWQDDASLFKTMDEILALTARPLILFSHFVTQFAPPKINVSRSRLNQSLGFWARKNCVTFVDPTTLVNRHSHVIRDRDHYAETEFSLLGRAMAILIDRAILAFHGKRIAVSD